ncbi:MAG: hypothetical protein C5B49_11365 [Bdellovibrio sp.]|nr:MAG: hypothetical protein C5B49_11365 [Bdellovibrio sp.]
MMCLALPTLICQIGKTDDLRVVEVRRNIPLSDHDPVYKDYYISGAGVAALKVDQVVTASRNKNIMDSAGTQSLGELRIPVGQLKIIFVQDNLAVAREFKLLDRQALPMIEQVGVMAGDLVQLKDSFIAERKPDSVQRKHKIRISPKSESSTKSQNSTKNENGTKSESSTSENGPKSENSVKSENSIKIETIGKSGALTKNEGATPPVDSAKSGSNSKNEGHTKNESKSTN